MLTINSVSNTVFEPKVNQTCNNNVNTEEKVASQSSTYVNLHNRVSTDSNVKASSLTASDALSFAKSIADSLDKNSFSVQSNMSAFEAAALLA